MRYDERVMSDIEQIRFEVLVQALATYGYTAVGAIIGLPANDKPRD